MMKRTCLSAILLLAAALPAWAQEPSPYAGQEERAIKALSEREIDDLRQGRGMGYAKAAELNGYPGPRHVLDMADALGLTPAQRAATEALFEAMGRDARALGAQLVDAEAELDALFAAGAADPGAIAVLTARAARLEGELRAVHLSAHAALRPVLTEHQRRHYGRLRGYAGGAAGHGAHGAGG